MNNNQRIATVIANNEQLCRIGLLGKLQTGQQIEVEFINGLYRIVEPNKSVIRSFGIPANYLSFTHSE